jgi:hypothetical protein
MKEISYVLYMNLTMQHVINQNEVCAYILRQIIWNNI